jgi:hypothetical protein
MLTLHHHPRIAVVGTSCSGKSTLSRQLADVLQRPHVELDALHFGPDWSVRPDFVDAVRRAADTEEWIIDGNYTEVRNIVWARATAVVWLDYPFPVVFRQAMTRTIRRVWSREVLHGGSRETFRGAFLQPDGMPLWVIRTYRRRRRENTRMLGEAEFGHLEVFRLSSRDQAQALLLASP